MKAPGEELPVNQYLAVWILLKRVNDALIKVRNRELRQYDINLEYKATLHAVRRLGDRATPGEIARLRCRRPHTISQVLKNMEKGGLVARHRT
ncbi:MAG: helix-turn-helix domain-containing protein [Chloroflexota bacterium]